MTAVLIKKLVPIALSTLSAAAMAAPMNFDFKDPKGVNNAVFKLDAPLESINGTANGISGSVEFDPENPTELKGKIIVAASSLHVGNPTMKEHLHSENWMNVARYPQIIFEVVSAKNAKTDGNNTTLDVTGNLTIKGVSKELTVPVKLTYLKDKLQARVPNKKGDLLVVRANLTIKRSDFNINKAQMEEKVSNDIDLSLSLAGAAPKS
jgi:polyisoprenoid-binding protein YceI